jgi:hypothetical protein
MGQPLPSGGIVHAGRNTIITTITMATITAIAAGKQGLTLLMYNGATTMLVALFSI